VSEEHRLLPRFRQAQLNARAAEKLKPILIEAERPLPKPKPIASEPGDAHKLRGIPAVGVRGGLGGAIAGTRPGVSRELDEWSPPRALQESSGATDTG
jgi:hypothetical protein